jgi:hypothetical protein
MLQIMVNLCVVSGVKLAMTALWALGCKLLL